MKDLLLILFSVSTYAFEIKVRDNSDSRIKGVSSYISKFLAGVDYSIMYNRYVNKSLSLGISQST